MKKNLIIFDGICLFCEGWVNFVLKNTKKDNENYFIPLQYINFGEIIKKKINSDASIILLDENEDIYFKSDASLRVMTSLKSIYALFAFCCLFIPKIIRNFIYDIIGKNRYYIWGKRDFCKLPSSELLKFFPRKNDEIPEKIRSIFEKNFTWK